MIASLRHSWQRWVEETDHGIWFWRIGCLLAMVAIAFVVQMIFLVTL